MQPALATASNSGLPLGRVKKAEDAKVRAAGMILISPSGTALFLRRSGGADDKGDHVGEWCLPAGVIEDGEELLDAAIRGTREETGFVTPDDAAPPVQADESDEDVEFTTFARKVGNEFAPTLNDEHDGWAWAPLDKPPEPTHPGVIKTMGKLKAKLGQDSNKFETAILTSADNIKQLRSSDVFRVLDENRHVTGLAAWIKQKRPDLAGKVDEAVGELGEDAANEATEKELRTTIKFPPPRAGGGNSRAINTSFANGGGGTREKELKKVPEAEAFENSGGLTKKDRTAKDAAPLRTLYARRNLLNAAEVEAWARGQGLVGVLSDMHVTIAYSKEPFDWTGVGTEGGDLSVVPSGYRVEQLGDEGAVVLRFQSKELSRRHRELKDAGAVWRYPSYKPHVTLTYQGGDELPGDLVMYEGKLVFGSEIFEEIDQEKRDAALKQSLVGDCAVEIIALDEASVREYDMDGRLRVAISNISKANVCPYLGSEIPGWEELGLEKDKIYKLLRDPEELERAAPTFNGIQLMMRHVPVSADDAQQWDVIGTTGTDAVFEAPYLKNSLIIWTRAGIDAIESGKQRELSSAYHYRPDMKPGKYEGENFDGKMCDIVGNHVATVFEGRVGSDVIVGDSKEKINMKTNNEKGLSRTAGIALLTTAAFLRPRLAQDVRLDLRPAFRGVTAKNYGEQKANVVAKISDLVRGKLAADSSIGEVAQLLDMIEKHGAEEGGEDDDMEEPMMDAAEEIGEKFAEKDAMDAEPLAEVESFLKDKLSDEDLAAVCSMLRGGETEDEDPKLDELGAADQDEQERKDNKKTEAAEDDSEEMEDRVKENKGAKDEPPPFKGKPRVGGAMDKNLVSKSAMDAALKDVREQTAQAVMKTQREIRDAEKRVRPWVGDISVACDSADAVFKAALASLGVKGLDKIHPSAYSHVLDAQPLPGTKKQSDSRPAMDSASVASFAERFPGAARIGLA